MTREKPPISFREPYFLSLSFPFVSFSVRIKEERSHQAINPSELESFSCFMSITKDDTITTHQP